MTDVFEVASWVSSHLDELGFKHCVIGGVALQAWGEPRVTRDVDVSVLVGFGDEARLIASLLERFPPRIESALAYAIDNRVLLCRSPEGVGIDMGLAAFPFEEAFIDRSRPAEFLPGLSIPVVCAEDLVTMKVFAGRPRDWEDVRGILVRQGSRLDWGLVEAALPELLELIEAPERMDRLRALRDESK